LQDARLIVRLYQTIKARPEFLQLAKSGRKHASHTMVVQYGAPAVEADTTPVLGITVTKKVGNAVVRNRLKRQIRAAFQELTHNHQVKAGRYVIIARDRAKHADFAKLQGDMHYCIRKVTA
jgi:ribonuclease P protein component